MSDLMKQLNEEKDISKKLTVVVSDAELRIAQLQETGREVRLLLRIQYY